MKNLLVLTAALLMLGAAPAEPVREMVAKHWDALPAAESSEAVPSAPAEKWGKWHFWNGQWWARTMFQKEAQGPSWDPPAAGCDASWNSWKCVWLRTRRKVPSEWGGAASCHPPLAGADDQ